MSNERNIKTSILLIILKYIAVDHSSGNFTGRLFRAVEYAIPFFFFWYLIHSVFQEIFVKRFMKKLSFFSSNFENQFSNFKNQKLLNIRMSKFVIMKWPFEYKIKSFKICPFCSNKKCWHFEFFIKYFGNDSSFLIK